MEFNFFNDENQNFLLVSSFVTHKADLVAQILNKSPSFSKRHKVLPETDTYLVVS
jgi:hypothetical protein